MIFDTGSGWLAATNTWCENCDNHPKYDPTKSTSMKKVVGGEDQILTYGSAQLTGDDISDKVCSGGLCLDEFEFLAIKS